AGAVVAAVVGDVARRRYDLRATSGYRADACLERTSRRLDGASQAKGQTKGRESMKENTIALALLSALLVTPAAAQTGDAKAELVKLKPNDFPTAPIEYTVVYPAGGGMDVPARLLAKYVEKWSDHRIIVNNRTGGAGMVGHAYLATQAKPDGYTVGIIANLMWGDAMLRAQGRWTYTDLEPIGYLNSDALTWIGPTEGPYKDMSAQGFYSEFRGLADAGKVRPVGVAASERLSFLKDTPTMNEALGEMNTSGSSSDLQSYRRGRPRIARPISGLPYAPRRRTLNWLPSISRPACISIRSSPTLRACRPI